MAEARGVRIVLALIGLAVITSVVGVTFLYLVVTRGPSVDSGSTLMLHVRGTLPEVESGGVIGQLIAERQTVRSIVESLRKAKVDRRISSVVLAPGGIDGLWGKLQEVRDAITDFRSSGKQIVAYLEYGSARDYYLATACDAIYLMPVSPLDLTGLASYEVFLRGAFDKLGAYPDFLQLGEYKTAGNTFTEKTFTPTHREMAESLNQDLYGQLVRGIAEGREMTEAAVRALIDRGPFLPEEALQLGLVDDLAYRDQLNDKASLGADDGFLEDSEYQKVDPGSLGVNRGPRIAVIYAVGIISTGESSSNSLQGSIVGSETLVRHLRDARTDDSIEAIVLRVDSPGGSAIASDVIWREVLQTRDHKPVIASMSDVAASGGYYISMPAETVVAQPGTITGSIGVVMGKFALDDTFAKLGMNVEAVTSGRMADINSPVRRYSDAERAKLAEQLQAVYDTFVEKAAQARQTTPERIEAVAKGRVWTGRQAQRLGLVDEIGGLEKALALAKRSAGLPEDAEVEIVVYPARRWLFELVGDPFAQMAEWRLFGPGYQEMVSMMAAPLTVFRGGEPLAIMPYSLLH